MSMKMIQERLDRYAAKSQQEEENALKEITQELALNSLYNAGFFKKAAFQGGTCLRILHGLNRFSEDLDFALIEPAKTFELGPHLTAMNEELSAFGYDVKIESRTSAENAVKNAFLKDDSLGRLLNVRYKKTDGPARAIKIKIEIDTNPPLGANIETQFHDFPINFAVTTHDLPSLFAGKSHALLVREYVKGRDWFDFLWYVARKVRPNYDFLANALDQAGPWKGKAPQVDEAWYRKELSRKIASIDWKKASADVERFLRPSDVRTLELWSQAFFQATLDKW